MNKYISGAINFNLPENKYSKYEYEIFNNIIDTNIEEGLILFAYNSNLKRSDGSYGIPAVETFIDAVKAKCLSEAYAYLARVKETNTAEKAAQREAANFVSKHLLGKKDLVRIPYADLVLSISKNKYHHFKSKSFRSGMDGIYPDNIQLCINDSFRY